MQGVSMNIRSMLALFGLTIMSIAQADVQFINNTPYKIKAQIWWEGGINNGTITKEIDPKKWVLMEGDIWNNKTRVQVFAKLGAVSADTDWTEVYDSNKRLGSLSTGGNRIFEVYTIADQTTGEEVFDLSDALTGVGPSFGLTGAQLLSKGITQQK